jgi:rhodanese-related sulfurtransferase
MSPATGRPEIKATDLLERIAAGRAPRILDVRSRREYDRGHVPGALHVPFWMLRWRLHSIPGSRDEPLVVYCGHGPRAWLAGSVLRSRGFTHVVYLAGHYSRWHEAGLREERPAAGEASGAGRASVNR